MKCLLLPLLLAALATSLASSSAEGNAWPRGVSDKLDLENGLARGDWGTSQFCPDQSFVFGFQIKFHSHGHSDDTAVNALKLYCRDISGQQHGHVNSKQGSQGSWLNTLMCPGLEFITGMRGYVVPNQGSFKDDMAVDNVQMLCEGGTVLDGRTKAIPALESDQGSQVKREKVTIEGKEVEAVTVSEDAKASGAWSPWYHCSSGSYVCGLETRVEKKSLFTDDAALSDFTIYCCS